MNEQNSFFYPQHFHTDGLYYIQTFLNFLAMNDHTYVPVVIDELQPVQICIMVTHTKFISSCKQHNTYEIISQSLELKK